MSSRLSLVRLFAILWTVAHQAPLSMGFSRQEYWNGLPKDLPGIEPMSPASPALAGGSLPLVPRGSKVNPIPFHLEREAHPREVKLSKSVSPGAEATGTINLCNTQQVMLTNCWRLSVDDGEGNGNPLQYSCLENPMDGGARRAAVHGVAKSQTQLSNFTFTFHFHALEKEMATHSGVLAWRIPGTGEPGGLPSVGSHRVGRD